MGRKPRQHFGGAFYHFIARGNNRQPIFLAESDRRAFEWFLSDGVERFGHRNHAYCWMTSHVHMAIEVANVPLSHVAHNLLFRYARWFHRKYGRSGHLFERRYRAFLIRTDAAHQSLVRYIHLNPVRAAIVDSPSAYPWSSYSAYSDLGSPGPSWLTRNFVLSLFGETPVSARAALRAFTELEVGDGVEDRAQPVTPGSESELGSYEDLAANAQHVNAEQATSSSITSRRFCARSVRRAPLRAQS